MCIFVNFEHIKCMYVGLCMYNYSMPITQNVRLNFNSLARTLWYGQNQCSFIMVLTAKPGFIQTPYLWGDCRHCGNMLWVWGCAPAGSGGLRSKSTPWAPQKLKAWLIFFNFLLCVVEIQHVYFMFAVPARDAAVCRIRIKKQQRWY